MTIKQFPELHDAHLVGITYLPASAIQLDFQRAGAGKSLLLTGVVHFFCTGMLEGNIVESVGITALVQSDPQALLSPDENGSRVTRLPKRAVSPSRFQR